MNGLKVDKVVAVRYERRVGFLHTTPATIGMVDGYVRSLLPLIKPVHIYDGRVKIDNFGSPVGVTPKTNLLRWANFAADLERVGCELIVSCCSLMPRATDFSCQVVSVPCIQLDSVILDQCVEMYTRIGVLTTTPYTVPYIIEGLNARAARLGKKLELEFGGDPVALEMFNDGDYEKHDDNVLESIRELESRRVECVLLGQVPFALMEEKIRKLRWNVPVMYAGTDAFKYLGRILES